MGMWGFAPSQRLHRSAEPIADRRVNYTLMAKPLPPISIGCVCCLNWVRAWTATQG